LREYEEIYNYEQYKRYLRVTKGKLESLIEGLEEKAINGILIIHAFTAPV